jgi:hypothetical protein
MQDNNDQFQKTAKQEQMDSSYERLMAERQTQNTSQNAPMNSPSQPVHQYA